MIITDGQENASHEWTRAKVKDRLDALKKNGWTFLFLGANIDAFTEGATLGMPMAGIGSFSNDTKGVDALYRSVSTNYAGFRTMVLNSVGPVSAEVREQSLQFTDVQRASMNSATSGSVTK